MAFSTNSLQMRGIVVLCMLCIRQLCLLSAVNSFNVIVAAAEEFNIEGGEAADAQAEADRWELLYKTTTLVKCKVTNNASPFTIEVRHEWSPLGAARFVELIRDGYFKDVALFRCVKKFLVQFGISGDVAKRAKWNALPNIPDDPNIGVPIKRGMISFAGGGKDSRSTQVFIAFHDLNFLGKSPWETAFGMVIDGMEEIVDNVCAGYGDQQPFNKKGVNQSRIQSEGIDYLKKEFPDMIYIEKCWVVGDDVGGIQGDGDEAAREAGPVAGGLVGAGTEADIPPSPSGLGGGGGGDSGLITSGVKNKMKNVNAPPDFAVRKHDMEEQGSDSNGADKAVRRSEKVFGGSGHRTRRVPSADRSRGAGGGGSGGGRRARGGVAEKKRETLKEKLQSNKEKEKEKGEEAVKLVRGDGVLQMQKNDIEEQRKNKRLELEKKIMTEQQRVEERRQESEKSARNVKGAAAGGGGGGGVAGVAGGGGGGDGDANGAQQTKRVVTPIGSHVELMSVDAYAVGVGTAGTHDAVLAVACVVLLLSGGILLFRKIKNSKEERLLD